MLAQSHLVSLGFIIKKNSYEYEFLYMKGGYTLDQLPAHCRAGADRCYAVPPRSFAHYVANFEMQMEAPTLWTMDNQFDHKASGVRAAFSRFWSKSNWSCKKNASFPRQRFFMLSSRSVTIQGPGMYRFTFYHYVSTSITKFKGNWKWNKSNWQKEHLRERHTVCLSMISHSWLCWLSTPSWIFVTAWRRPEEDLNTHRRTHTFLCKYFYICQLRQCVVVVVVAHIFSFCQSNAYHSVTLPLTIKQGCSLGDGGFGGGGVVGGWRGISEHLPLSGRGETKHRHSGLALKHLSGTHG